MSPTTTAANSLPFKEELLPSQPPEAEILARRKTLIKQTWLSMEFGLGEDATVCFYDRLFAKFPGVEPLFANTSIQVQSHKLYLTLRLAVRSLDELDAIIPSLQELGRRHAQSYGVVREYYGAVTQTFIEVLHEFICSKWTNMACSRYMVDVADAWAWCLNLVGGVMADAAEEAGAEERGLLDDTKVPSA